MRHDRHLARVPITTDLIDQMVREDYYVPHGIVCLNGVPADAEFVRAYYDQAADCVNFVYRHPSFPFVPENEAIEKVIIPDHRTIKRTEKHALPFALPVDSTALEE